MLWPKIKKDKNDDEPKPPAPRWDENNPTINYRGEKRSNQTHCSTTDPEAMLARKGRGKEAKLSYHGHLMTEKSKRAGSEHACDLGPRCGGMPCRTADGGEVARWRTSHLGCR
jgi:hypothetical protein